MPIPKRIKPISRFSMSEEVYSTLLMWIMEGELRPGEKLLDKELAEKMGVSRTPVREALRRLEDKGLVESSANRWTRVTDISIEEPAKIYPIIWTLEELAIVAAMPNMTEADIGRMEAANQELETALACNDPVSASRIDAQFHDVFIERTDNPFLVTILQDLKIRYRRVEVTYFEGSSLAADSAEEHRQILAALRAGDVPRARATILNNWQNSLSRLVKLTSDAEDKDDF